ncbi:DUF1788 domain-containing protein [Cerasibacillus terrae]|uniref:DUF1788 domain-containing protein n=1 Tax=Cerasibacillus terrae TaxID=2498845 RepID=A0A5C8NTV8_9BACI|nr:DUF1788 domain-containing protein [Cerasibacillus terrae]TXL64465.1 DUF1788 domain-containing protein [Cerasibacillus terrae]
MTINSRLQKIREKIQDDAFIQGRGLGNEISFYIFDYDPKHELIVRDEIKSLKRTFRHEMYNRHIIEFDLYKILLEVAKEKRIYQQIFEMEKTEGNEFLFGALTDFAIPEIFMDYIMENIGNHNVIFLTGVGKIYPFVRSHTILNNLQEKIDRIPVIMFYPGEYDGQSLNLFGKFKDENYYRAFQLVDHK